MVGYLSTFGNSILKLLKEPVSFGSEYNKDKQKDIFNFQSLSQLLPYQAYDEETGIYINKNSIGFVIETHPLVGGDESVGKMLNSIISEIMKEGDSIQFLLFADHRIDPFLNKWKSTRIDRDIYKSIVDFRSDHYRKKSTLFPRIFRFIVSYSCPHKGNLIAEMSRLSQNKDKIEKNLGTMSSLFSWEPQDFLRAVGGLVNFDLSTSVEQRQWNPFQLLSSQIPTGGKIEVEEDYLLWKREKEVAFKTYRSINTPDYMSMQVMGNLIGDVMRDSFQIPCPFFIQYGVHMPNQEKSESSFWRRSQLIENQGKSGALIRLIPDLAHELKECDYVRRSLNSGAKFVWTQLSTGIWAEKQDISIADQALRSIFRINQFTLAENRCLHLPHFISMLPMTWGEYSQDLKELDVMKSTITPECANFIPIQGEWQGTPTPGMLLVGRRGQLLNWNPFDNQSGNYNCVVVGRSGSGKSVFMQELMLTGLSTGSRVYVLDVGKSYEKLCDMLGGQKIEFSKNTEICLNPFSKISLIDQEERETAFAFLKSIISCMAAPTQGTTDYENAMIEKAIQDAWTKKGNEASVTDVAVWLQEQKEEKAQSIAVMLTPYIKGGVYAKYFEGKNNISFSNPMVLIELEELKNKKDLQSVVLQLCIMTIANEAFLGDRKTPFYICIDEAWDLLRSKQTGEFIETLARRLRKYYGSLVVGTQSVEDFFVSPGAQAAYDNSDWMCLLSQKKSSLAGLVNDGKLNLNKNMLRALESVNTRHGEYSEVMICDGDGNYSIARLILDPFSQLLFSTKAQDYSDIKFKTDQGMSVSNAIRTLLLDRKQG